jgi:hypothetical protein
MDIVNTIELSGWSPELSEELAARYTHALESGQLLFFPMLAFEPLPEERHLLSPRWSDGKAKNISYDPRIDQVRHTSAEGADRAALGRFMGRFAHGAKDLVDRLFPAYREHIRFGLSSFRPVEAEGRASSRKKDDTLVHVDAFASRPNQGERILRVFSNVNPEGRPREWVIGEPFPELARRFVKGIPKPLPGSSWFLKTAGITKGVRTAYDHYMLQLHDRGKLDGEYQESCPKTAVSLPAGSSWAVFTDSVPHAVKSGQYALEQTFHLPVSTMQYPALSPLRILESLLGERLAA